MPSIHITPHLVYLHTHSIIPCMKPSPSLKNTSTRTLRFDIWYFQHLPHFFKQKQTVHCFLCITVTMTAIDKDNYYVMCSTGWPLASCGVNWHVTLLTHWCCHWTWWRTQSRLKVTSVSWTRATDNWCGTMASHSVWRPWPWPNNAVLFYCCKYSKYVTRV